MKLNLKRKIIYTILTTPFGILTYKAFKWQTRRRLEKIEEVKSREQLLKKAPLLIDNSFFSHEINSKNYEFNPVQLVGFFDESKRVLINKTKEDEPGYQIISPFYCFDNNLTKSENESGNERNILIVDRGWVPYDYFNFEQNRLNLLQNKTKIIKLNGIIYKGDKKNKYSKNNTPKEDDINSNDSKIKEIVFSNLYPDEIAEHFKLKNRQISSQFVIKLVNLSENIIQNQYPKLTNYDELMEWRITPQRHQDYANFWITATFLNIISNLIVWVII